MTRFHHGHRQRSSSESCETQGVQASLLMYIISDYWNLASDTPTLVGVGHFQSFTSKARGASDPPRCVHTIVDLLHLEGKVCALHDIRRKPVVRTLRSLPALVLCSWPLMSMWHAMPSNRLGDGPSNYDITVVNEQCFASMDTISRRSQPGCRWRQTFEPTVGHATPQATTSL